MHPIFRDLYVCLYRFFVGTTILLLLWRVRSKTSNLAHYDTLMPDRNSNNDIIIVIIGKSIVIYC